MAIEQAFGTLIQVLVLTMTIIHLEQLFVASIYNQIINRKSFKYGFLYLYVLLYFQGVVYYMKYKIYDKIETIKKYSIKKNIFNQKYIVKLQYVDSDHYSIYKNDNKKEVLEYERYILDKMNKQIQDLLKEDSKLQDSIAKMLDRNDRIFNFVSTEISLIIPLILTIIYQNGANMLLYLPFKIINYIMREKLTSDYSMDITDDIQKYMFFSENIELFENYGKYVTKNNKNITANNIDKYSLEKLEMFKTMIQTLIENDNSKILKKEKS